MALSRSSKPLGKMKLSQFARDNARKLVDRVKRGWTRAAEYLSKKNPDYRQRPAELGAAELELELCAAERQDLVPERAELAAMRTC
jgi:hypothetical protein